MSVILPKLDAMLICDSIITEAGTNKKSLIGVFDNIGTPTFPCKHHMLSVYVKFTDAQGKYDFKLDLIDLQTSKVIGEGIVQGLEVSDRLASSELAFNLLGLTFPNEGKYQFRIFANNQFFGSKTFNVISINKKIG